ncbi:isochorismatase hydrolase [Arthrobacter crystallopoietes BAB-32]|uniref:Isochorismatase hydrolase n=1 Tax=Arthrobacter crystallopoietes BAB-32 TaxID=1246476 RepID=N1UZD3_9MICC|nr:isochorismatase family protein [Arthrobacter crystallopoietes]EMY33154.1 isochorismatase hydrolase [Arthrobacter crystallopoietes BAB-32]
MPERAKRHLVVVDMQRVFRRNGDWHVPRYDEAAEAIARLVAAGHPPILTRFVPDPAEEGSWSAYYDRWRSMRLDPADEAWDLELPGVETSGTIDLPTFGKWGEELAQRIPVGEELLLTGVATDCCVLATALAAADAGRYVTVITDACAGQNDQAHQATLDLLELLSPMVRLATSAEVAASPQAAAV